MAGRFYKWYWEELSPEREDYSELFFVSEYSGITSESYLGLQIFFEKNSDKVVDIAYSTTFMAPSAWLSEAVKAKPEKVSLAWKKAGPSIRLFLLKIFGDV